MEKKVSQKYYKRKLKAGKIKRQIEAKKHSIRVLRLFIKLVLIILVTYFCIFILKLTIWHIDINKLKTGNFETVIIKGNKITSNYKILNIIRRTDFKQNKIYKLNTKELEKNILELEPVKRVHVRRFGFPARLVVIIEEKEPIFEISSDFESEPTSAITKEGIFIGQEYMPLPNNTNTIKIIGNAFKNYDEWNKEKVDEILKLAKTIETYSNQKILYIDLKDPNDMYIQLEKVLIRIGEINTSLDERIKTIPTILPQIEDLYSETKYLDLRFEDAKYIKLNSTSNYNNENNEKFKI